jgi:hypothetical protein
MGCFKRLRELVAAFNPSDADILLDFLDQKILLEERVLASRAQTALMRQGYSKQYLEDVYDMLTYEWQSARDLQFRAHNFNINAKSLARRCHTLVDMGLAEQRLHYRKDEDGQVNEYRLKIIEDEDEEE